MWALSRAARLVVPEVSSMLHATDRSPVSLRETVLVIDDDEIHAHQVKTALKNDRRDVFVCTSLREAVAVLPEMVPDLVVTTLELPEAPGTKVLEVLKVRAPAVPVLVSTTRPSLEVGMEAVRAGALEVLSRPTPTPALVAAVDRALSSARTSRELEQAREQLRDKHGFSHLLTQSARMLTVFDQIRAVAGTDATVLIRGETGTGKELVSRAIHERSRRRDKPFISVNCGAFTETLLESELFGHETGAFTGATGRRQGVFEMADGGTLFLDELGETSLNVQVNLLRVLEEMCFRRLGGHDMVHVDVRIVAATNVTLEEAVKKGAFREDLFYRLNVFPIHLPPLRERPEDIPLLCRHFLEDAAKEYGLSAPTISAEAMKAIVSFRWPGNVRQLRSLCERWVIVCGGKEVRLDNLPTAMRDQAPTEAPSFFAVDENVPMTAAVEQAVAQVERAYLHRLLSRTKGHLIKTSEAAGITRRTLYSKMKAYGLDADDYRAR